jgi:hypothetical protein
MLCARCAGEAAAGAVSASQHCRCGVQQQHLWQHTLSANVSGLQAPPENRAFVLLLLAFSRCSKYANNSSVAVGVISVFDRQGTWQTRALESKRTRQPRGLSQKHLSQHMALESHTHYMMTYPFRILFETADQPILWQD